MHYRLFLGPSVLEGLRAAKSLLKGSQRVPDRLRHFSETKEFQKHGSFNEAWNDFHSVHPQDIKEAGIPGKVGLTFKDCQER